LIRQWLLACLLAVPLWLHAQTGGAASRTALIIGNAAYTKPDAALKNAVSDARLMRQTFESLGFEVIYREDVDGRGMKAAFRDFQDVVRKKKGIAAFYFAGHGVQVQGRNYIVPIGAHLQKDTDARDAALDVDVMLQAVRDTGAQLNLFILDACRNNPLLATQRGNAGGAEGGAAVGLAQMTPPAGALVAFATEPGHVAADGADAGHGLYTKHLSKWLKVPDIPLEQVFKRTREAVKAESGDTQSPVEYSMLTGADFYLTKATARLQEQSIAQGKKSLGLSREAGTEDALDAAAPRSIEQGRKDLAAFGAKFTRADFLKAIDGNDTLLLSAFMDAKLQFGTDVIWRSLGISYSDLNYPQRSFPKKSMQYFVDHFDETGLSKKDLCSGKADIDALEQLKNGAREFAKSYGGWMDIAGMVKIRRDYYFKFCGIDLTKPQPKSNPSSAAKKDAKNDFSWIAKAKEQVQKDREYYNSPEAKKQAELLLKEFQQATGKSSSK
jgi:Caspase domain